MKYLKTINAIYGLILGLGSASMIISGRIFEGGPVGTVGTLLGMVVFAPPFGLAFYALRDRDPKRIRLALWWNVAVLVALAVTDTAIFIDDPKAAANSAALLAFQLIAIALPAALNVTAMRGLRAAYASTSSPNP